MTQRTDEETRRLFDAWAATYEADLVDADGPARALHEVAHTRRLDALRELTRVLKPGGARCLLDFMFASSAA